MNEVLAHKITDLTGPGFTDRFHIGGTDLGVLATAPDGRLVAVFGDTFRKAGVGGLGGWRAPVALFAEPSSITGGLSWTGAAGGPRRWVRRRGDRANQLARYVHQLPGRSFGRRFHRVTTKLPTDVITVGGTMYLHVMVCRELGRVHWTELHASLDGGRTWLPTGTRWRGDHLGGMFQMLTWERGGDGYVYAFTTGFQRDKGLILHRVPEGRLTDPEAWEPWGTSADGPAWGHPPTVVLPGAFGELCLRRVPASDGTPRWMLVAFDAGNYRIDVIALDGLGGEGHLDLHVAPRTTVLRGVNWEDEDHAAGRVAQLYGGYVVPGSTWADLHLVVSQWNTTTNWPYKAMQFQVSLPD